MYGWIFILITDYQTYLCMTIGSYYGTIYGTVPHSISD